MNTLLLIMLISTSAGTSAASPLAASSLRTSIMKHFLHSRKNGGSAQDDTDAAVQWTEARSVNDAVKVGDAASKEACYQMCLSAQTDNPGKTACAYQCNGCYVGSSLAVRSSESHSSCFQYGTIVQACDPATTCCDVETQEYCLAKKEKGKCDRPGTRLKCKATCNELHPELCGDLP